jgi:GH15 family glucan-1,4-alpha-glucosidase
MAPACAGRPRSRSSGWKRAFAAPRWRSAVAAAEPAELEQPPIGDYALLGDTRAAALISRRGSVDWLCVPRFDADPVFGRLIDPVHGGRFELRIEGEVESRAYRGESAVLETLWRGPVGAATVCETMPADVSGLRPQLTLVRRVECTAGEVDVVLLFDPRLGLPGRRGRAGKRGTALICEWGSLALVLQSFPPQALEPGVAHVVRLRQGSTLTLVASLADRGPAVLVSEADAAAMLAQSERDWQQWAREVEYDGPFRRAVIRSLITLRLLTYSPSGAPVAAPTTSLPERLGGDLNWDYRYAWPRDAGIGSGAFMAAGRTQEAQAFLRWLEIASRLTLPRMKVLYTLDGTPGHREREIPGVSGYCHSLPVRAANAAADQHQLDVYGWVVDTAWHLASLGSDLDGPSWRMTQALADFVARCWREPDAGIWEPRGEPRQHVSSKLLAYVALDRAARIARKRGEGGRRVQRWERERELLRTEVRERGWNPRLNSYTAAYGSDDLDASVLLLAMSEVDDDRRERVQSTIAAIRSRLGAGGPLVYRYLAEGDQPPAEGAFLACGFWLVDALARCGRVDEAEELLEQAIALSGELGLLAEEADPASGTMLGNHPQALSHSTLVAAALSIEKAKAEEKRPGSHRKRRAPAA